MTRPRLHTLVLGEIGSDPHLPTWLARELGAELGMEATEPVARTLDDDWRDSETGTVRSDRLVDALAAGAPAGWTIAVVDADLAAPGRKFVFGEATLGGPFAVVALPRLTGADRAATRLRVLKEAMHEIGHLGGLGHCDDAACVMAASASTRQIDRKLAAFCDRCSRRLALPPPP